MKCELALILALGAFSAAMVPRERRTIDTNAQNERQICADQTPCGWTFYKSGKIRDKIFDQTVMNSYCSCKAGFECAAISSDDDDDDSDTTVHKCKEML